MTYFTILNETKFVFSPFSASALLSSLLNDFRLFRLSEQWLI